MKLKINQELIHWSLAVIQPASADDVCGFIGALYPDDGPLPNPKDVQQVLDRFHKLGWSSLVNTKAKLYSITEKGNERISKSLRYSRDRLRIFLLKSARNDSFVKSEEVAQESSGDSPGIDVSSGVKEVARPVDSAKIPHGRRGSLARNFGRVYWPRLLEQLDSPVGLTATSSDAHFSYYSFPSISSINEASIDSGEDRDVSPTGLALAIGISPRLIGYFLSKPHRHYRRFEIGKRGGGTRVIHSPRVFLKTVQYFLNDYLLWRLPANDNCHSYKVGKSIISNASGHVGKKFVGNIDIQDYFGSVSTSGVQDLLCDCGFGDNIARTIARLGTLNNELPQGAPTSPTISNAFLYRFDRQLSAICKQRGLHYSRYADDITFSGDDKEKISQVISESSTLLREFGLRLNDKKTRIASQSGQQRVTGVVVNEVLQPPRKLRREIRAMFHRAQTRTGESHLNIRRLRGYVSYLNSFSHLRDSSELNGYREILRELTN